MRLSRPKVGLPRLGLPHLPRPALGRPRFGRPAFVVLPAVLARPATMLRPGARFERFAWLPAGVVLAAIVVVASVYSGTVHGTDVTLVLMGFDPDRAQLITALVISAVAAGTVALVVDRILYGSILGTGALIALFAETFGAETQNARNATGETGTFDMSGWVLTLVTLLVIGFVASWAGATLAAAVRPPSDRRRRRREGTGEAPPARHRSWCGGRSRRCWCWCCWAWQRPAFGDMVNLSPDALMLQGDQGGGLVNQFTPPPVADATPTPTPPPSPTTGPSATGSSSGTPIPTPSPTPLITAKPGSKPWLAWKPSGTGHITLSEHAGAVDRRRQRHVGDRRLYAARLRPQERSAVPGGLRGADRLDSLGQGHFGVIDSLDTLISAGEIPASIVVFIDSLGPPYGDTECADMPNYQQWFETYISTTVVYWVDHHFNTIRDPRARAIMGMSAGGFCAPMLALRHPDVWSVSISFSGYFWAGAAGSNSAYPFGNTAAAHSPALLVPTIPAADRARTFFIIVACPAQDFYGPGAVNFEQILKSNGFKYLNVDSPYTHGWPQVRYEAPGALQAWAAQLVNNGVW